MTQKYLSEEELKEFWSEFHKTKKMLRKNSKSKIKQTDSLDNNENYYFKKVSK